MLKHHVQLKLFAHQHNVKQGISTSTMCCVGSPCVFWLCQTEHETHHRPTFYSQVVRLTADQQSESQPLILSNVGPSSIMLIGRSSMSVLQTFMLPCCLTIQMKMCLALSKLFQITFWLCSVLPSSTSLLASTSLAVLWFTEAERAHQSFFSFSNYFDGWTGVIAYTYVSDNIGRSHPLQLLSAQIIGKQMLGDCCWERRLKMGSDRGIVPTESRCCLISKS